MITTQETSQKDGIKQAPTAKLLQRTIPADYRAAQTAQIAAVAQNSDRAKLLSALIFRLGREWLAIPAALCQQILSPIESHRLPHRTNSTLLGVVNVRGQLLLKVSLLEILGLSGDAGLLNDTSLESATSLSQQTFRGYRRMVVVEKSTDSGEKDIWAFEVDELCGVYSLCSETLQPAAAGTAAGAACTRCTFVWNHQQVSFLDENKLFAALRKKAL